MQRDTEPRLRRSLGATRSSTRRRASSLARTCWRSRGSKASQCLASSWTRFFEGWGSSVRQKRRRIRDGSFVCHEARTAKGRQTSSTTFDAPAGLFSTVREDMCPGVFLSFGGGVLNGEHFLLALPLEAYPRRLYIGTTVVFPANAPRSSSSSSHVI